MKILFIFHEAHLTGATLALFGTVKWYSENTDFSMSFLLKENGILKNEISKIGPVYNWTQEYLPKRNFVQKVVSRIIKPKSYRQKLLENLRNQKFDILYANTILCSDIIKDMAYFNCKIVWHIHELELAIKCLGKHHLEADKYVHAIIANSKSTMSNLVRNGIDKTKICVHYPFINIQEIQNLSMSISVRESLKIPSDSFIIGGSGSGIERKGIQNFIQLPLIINYLFPNKNFYYLWVGEICNKEVVQYDLDKSGIKDNFIFCGEQKNPFPYYKVFDIFVSCSKEESFGLSAIEAAALHKPLLCYKNTGGIEEIVEQANNITVPYLNIIEMAKKIIEIYSNKAKILALGNLAFETAKNFDIEIIMPKMFDYIKEIQKDTLCIVV